MTVPRAPLISSNKRSLPTHFLPFNCLETSHAHSQTAALKHLIVEVGKHQPGADLSLLNICSKEVFTEASALKDWRGCYKKQKVAAVRLPCVDSQLWQPDPKHVINLPERCLLVSNSRSASVLRNISSCFLALIAPLQAVRPIMKSDPRHFITSLASPPKPEPRH